MRTKVIAVLTATALTCTAGLYVSSRGIQDVQQFEGLERTAYLDAVNIPTICYGSTANVILGHTATEAECTARLTRDLEVAARGVRASVRHELTQDQFNALASFTFNVGVGNLKSSTLVRKANAGDCIGAGAEFNRWVYAKGTKLNGLVKRRAAERALWDSGCKFWA